MQVLSSLPSRLRARSSAAVTFCSLSSPAAAGVPFRAASACVGWPCCCNWASCDEAADPAVARPTAPVGPIRSEPVPCAVERTGASEWDASVVLRVDEPASEISRLTPLWEFGSTGPAPASRLLSVFCSALICWVHGPASATPLLSATTAQPTRSRFMDLLPRFSNTLTSPELLTWSAVARSCRRRAIVESTQRSPPPGMAAGIAV